MSQSQTPSAKNGGSVFIPFPQNLQSDQNGKRLIWHLCRLCNLTTTGLSTYLSLEALARETCTNGMFHGSLLAYQPVMRAQALMLSDMSRNLEFNRDALMLTSLHLDQIKHASYRSLIDAAFAIPTVINRIPQTISPFLDAPKLQELCLPKKDIVGQIRKDCDELTLYCTGDVSKGLTGWNQCWHDVNEVLYHHGQQDGTINPAAFSL